MSTRWVRGGAVLFFLLFVAAVTWPGMSLGNRIFPLILGLPFSMVWIASWVLLSFFVLMAVDLAEGWGRGTRGPGSAGATPGNPGAGGGASSGEPAFGTKGGAGSGPGRPGRQGDPAGEEG